MSNKIKILFSAVLFLTINIQPLQAGPAEKTLLREARRISISEGIKIVLRDSRLIKIALSDNEISFQDSLVSRSALLPHLNAFADRTFLRFQPVSKFGSAEVPTADKEYSSYGFDVYQTLFDFGKSLSNYRAAKDLAAGRRANTESIKRVATLEFIAAYFDLLEREKMISVFEKEIESLSSYLKDVEHMYEQGSAVENDLFPARVKLADARQRLISGDNAKELALAQLNNILCLPLRERIEAQDLEMPAPVFPDMEEAWESAQAQRPELAFYDSQIKASLAFERAKAVENFPEFFVDGGYAYTQNKYVVHQDNLSVDLGAKINLYDGGSSRALFLKERARQKQLNVEKDKLIEDIKFEIEDSYLSLKNACEKKSVASDALKQAGENVRFYRSKYAAGSATPTEVLEAITLETAAQTNYYSADYEVKRNYAKLMYSMGIDLGLIYEGMESGKNGR